jgi:uncharacterized protein YcfJ
MMIKGSALVAAAVLALSFSAPQANAGDGALAGGLLGAGAGAIIGGAATGKAGGAVAGAVIGGATGAIIGNQVEKDRNRRSSTRAASCEYVTNSRGRLLYNAYGEPRQNCYDSRGRLVRTNY